MSDKKITDEEKKSEEKKVKVLVPKHIKKYVPNSKEIITMQHALRLLNHLEILDILNIHKIGIGSKVKKSSELIAFLEHLHKEGELSRGLFNALRKKAFNPELYVTDGFILSYAEKVKLKNNEIDEYIDDWNNNYNEYEENEVSYTSKIELLDTVDRTNFLLVTRRQVKYAFDKDSMYSTKYIDDPLC